MDSPSSMPGSVQRLDSDMSVRLVQMLALRCTDMCRSKCTLEAGEPLWIDLRRGVVDIEE